MIELIEQASNEIAEYNKTEAALADLRSRMENVEYDVSTVKGLAVAKADRAEVRGLRTGLEAMRKSIKAPALEHCRLIDAEAARITTELLKLETPISNQIKARELEIEAERAAREATEKARITSITDRIAGIRQYVTLAASCRTAARIDELLGKLSLVSLADFAEFADEAGAAHLDAMKQVSAILDDKIQQESEQARIKAEQDAAAASLKAEREAFAAQQATERAAHAKAKAEADRLASERLAQIAKEVEAQEAAKAELDRQRAEFEAQVREANRVAAQAEADRIETPPEPFSSTPIYPLIPLTNFETEAPACCAPDGLCTDACSNSPALTRPTDAEVAWVAASEVADTFNLTLEQAIERLAAIRDWKL